MGSKKSPVSILHEYCIKRQEVPRYELVLEEKPNNVDTIFTFGIDLFDEYVTGSGPNKKSAKHETALALLKLLGKKDSVLLDFLKSNGLNDDSSIETPYVSHSLENFVGKLENLVLVNNLPSPVFKQRFEEGMSHDKIFTWTCSLGKLNVEASHRTKKQAKHTVAMLMIEELEKELGDDFINTIPEDFRVSYKDDDDLVLERKKVRTHLLGCKVLSQSSTVSMFSPVIISKLHRVITEPHLEVALRMREIIEEMEITHDRFDEFLDCKSEASLDKVCDIVNKLSAATGIDIDFVTLDLKTSQQSCETQSEKGGSSSHESLCSSLDKGVNNQSLSIDDEAISSKDELTESLQASNAISESSSSGSIPCRTRVEDFEAASSSSTTSHEGSTSQLSIFVMCKIFIVPPMHFLGISPSYEESKRKAAVLFLKHVNTLKSDNLRKHNFVENFSSGDEAEP